MFAKSMMAMMVWKQLTSSGGHSAVKITKPLRGSDSVLDYHMATKSMVEPQRWFLHGNMKKMIPTVFNINSRLQIIGPKMQAGTIRTASPIGLNGLDKNV